MNRLCFESEGLFLALQNLWFSLASECCKQRKELILNTTPLVPSKLRKRQPKSKSPALAPLLEQRSLLFIMQCGPLSDPKHCPKYYQYKSVRFSLEPHFDEDWFLPSFAFVIRKVVRSLLWRLVAFGLFVVFDKGKMFVLLILLWFYHIHIECWGQRHALGFVAFWRWLIRGGDFRVWAHELWDKISQVW